MEILHFLVLCIFFYVRLALIIIKWLFTQITPETLCKGEASVQSDSRTTVLIDCQIEGGVGVVQYYFDITW